MINKVEKLIAKWEERITDYRSYRENQRELFEDIEELWLYCLENEIKK